MIFFVCFNLHSPWSCSFCDSSQTAISHPVSFLNDHEETIESKTCWISGRVMTASGPILTESDLAKSNTKNVTLTVDFQHPYEISFILVNFCGPMPAAMVIYKSVSLIERFKISFKILFNC